MERISDYPFSVNKISLPNELHNIDALSLYIKKLLLMEKGDYESNPNMGVGIRNYRYNEKSSLDLLKNEIEKQIITFIPFFSNVSVDITSYNNKTVKFTIVLDDNILAFTSDETTYTLEDLKI